MTGSGIEHLDQLIGLIRGALRDRPDEASTLVNQWFDEDPRRYVDAVLRAELGTHHDQQAAYQHLSWQRRVELHRRAAAVCRAEGRRGLEAGAFTIGRFICTSHPVAFWNALEDHEVAWLLDEWVLHARYLRVLDEVGERRIQRARQRIAERGLAEVQLTQGDAALFVPLKLSQRDLARVDQLAGEQSDPQTRRLLEILRRPYRSFFDFDAPWSVGRLQRICDEGAIPLPDPDEA